MTRPRLSTTLTVLSLAFLMACEEDPNACDTEGAFQCADADILQMCSDGSWIDEEDCGDQGLMCHAEMGHCMAMEM